MATTESVPIDAPPAIVEIFPAAVVQVGAGVACKIAFAEIAALPSGFSTLIL